MSCEHKYERASDMILLSYPPKYEVKCVNCGDVKYETQYQYNMTPKIYSYITGQEEKKMKMYFTLTKKNETYYRDRSDNEPENVDEYRLVSFEVMLSKLRTLVDPVENVIAIVEGTESEIEQAKLRFRDHHVAWQNFYGVIDSYRKDVDTLKRKIEQLKSTDTDKENTGAPTSGREFILRMVDGEVFVDDEGLTYRFVSGEFILYNGADYTFNPMTEYKKVKPRPPQWYDKLDGTKSILCWVSEESATERLIALKVNRFEEEYFYDEKGCEWLYATPVTDDDLGMIGG